MKVSLSSQLYLFVAFALCSNNVVVVVVKAQRFGLLKRLLCRLRVLHDTNFCKSMSNNFVPTLSPTSSLCSDDCIFATKMPLPIATTVPAYPSVTSIPTATSTDTPHPSPRPSDDFIPTPTTERTLLPTSNQLPTVNVPNLVPLSLPVLGPERSPTTGRVKTYQPSVPIMRSGAPDTFPLTLYPLWKPSDMPATQVPMIIQQPSTIPRTQVPSLKPFAVASNTNIPSSKPTSSVPMTPLPTTFKPISLVPNTKIPTSKPTSTPIVPLSPTLKPNASVPATKAPTWNIPVTKLETQKPMLVVAPLPMPSTVKPQLIPTTKPQILPTMKPLAAKPTIAPAVSPVSSMLPTIRINCGEAATDYTDPLGYVWGKDRYWTAGSSYSVCGQNGTGSLQQKDCIDRFGNPVSYEIPVPFGGIYKVTLHFSENYYSGAGKRLFNVTAENNVLLSNLDLWVLAGGRYKPITRSFNVLVQDGTLSLGGIASINNAKFNAIEVAFIQPGTPSTSAPTSSPPPPNFQVVTRINCGNTTANYTDPNGNVWEMDRSWGTGTNFSVCGQNATQSLQNKDCTERYGTTLWYEIAVPAIGLYKVTLHFSENYHNAAGRRVFDVTAEGNIVLANLDIWSLAGGMKNKPIAQSFYVQVLDGLLSLRGIASVDNAKFNAIEIEKSLSDEIFVNCGSNSEFVDVLGRIWMPDLYHLGGTVYSSSQNITIRNSADTFLYQSERRGSSFSYAFPVTVAIYQINLYFAETEYADVGQRMFDLVVEERTMNDVDIVQLAQGPNSEAVIKFTESATDGFVNITFSSSAAIGVGIPKINAIHIRKHAEHLAHAVATGPYYGTVTNATTMKAKVNLIGSTSHSHANGEEINFYEWKEGGVRFANTSDLLYDFPVGNHTIELFVKDSGGNEDFATASVTIQEYGYPAITHFSPSNGLTSGGYNVSIWGSGFIYSSSETSVTFAGRVYNGSLIDIVNSTLIKLTVPQVPFAHSAIVTVKTPRGTSLDAFFEYIGIVPIQWSTGNLLNYANVIVAKFGPDKKLYVGTRNAILLKITLNEDFTTVVNTVATKVVPPESSTENNAICGIAFDPMDNKTHPDVYFTHNTFFHKGNQSSSGTTVGGRIRRASGPILDTIVDIITGLPVSDLDHGLNAIEFGLYGELYFTSGSHTNGGIPGKLSSSRTLKENFLSAAINVAYLFHPNFNGTIKWSAPDDGNMIAKGIDVFAHGVRNPFGLAIHSNGKLYATDNGPNSGYGRMSTNCVGGSIADMDRSDKLLYVQKGFYYGQPNLKRASFFNQSQQCIWRGHEVASTDGYKEPIGIGPSSMGAIFEYHSDHFYGQLRSNLIVTQYLSKFFRFVLTDDGTTLHPLLNKNPLTLGVGEKLLGATQAPNGNIVEVRYGLGRITYLKPSEPPTTTLIVKTVFPHRGKSSGGNSLTIYGVNFGTIDTTTVRVGAFFCPIISISSTVIDCILPGGSGIVNVTVSSGPQSSTFANGYTYVSGIQPQGFVLPVYTG